MSMVEVASHSKASSGSVGGVCSWSRGEVSVCMLGRRTVMRPERYSAPSRGHFVAGCRYPPVFQRGSKAVFLYYLILVRESGRKCIHIQAHLHFW